MLTGASDFRAAHHAPLTATATEVPWAPFNPRHLVSRLHDGQLPVAQAKGIDFRLDHPWKPLGWLMGDAEALTQVLSELITNAIRFTDEGEVALYYDLLNEGEDAPVMFFEVWDSGRGMDPALLDWLFRPRPRYGLTPPSPAGLRGQGLGRCAQWVAAMGGQIRGDSHPGLGSYFWVEIPYRPLDRGEVEAMTRDVVAVEISLAGLHVLVVDDNDINLDVAEHLLGKEGARVTRARQGQEALNHLRERPDGYDVVLMDIRMPVMDGLTASRLIRRTLGLTALPIIALTAEDPLRLDLEAERAGIDAILEKPLSISRLTACLTEVRPLKARSGPASPLE